MTVEGQSKPCDKLTSDKEFCQQLRNFQSLIYEAEHIKKQMAGVMELLRTNHIDSSSYKLVADLDTNIVHIREIFGESSDIVIRGLKVGERQAALVLLNEMVDKTYLQQFVITPLQQSADQPLQGDLYTVLRTRLLAVHNLQEDTAMETIIPKLFRGSLALFVDGHAGAFMMQSQGWKVRNIAEPSKEQTVRGSRESFVESINVNISMLRRRCADPNMIVTLYQVGEMVPTPMALAYVRGIVDPKLVEDVQSRLKKINVDYITDSGQVEAYLEDDPNSPFPQLQDTERPDKVVASLMEGRIALLVDGSPNVLLMPAVLATFYQAGDDYSERWIPASVIRFTRILSTFVSLLLPAIYIALISFHQGMLPTSLALTIAQDRMGLPFPTWLEAIIMEATLEILQEAGLRLPKPIGPTVGIVGGLVIGEAVVRAGLISPVMVVVIAATTVASHSLPSYSMGLTLRVLRLPMMLAATVLGLYGLTMAMMLLFGHVVKLTSFGEPYLAPMAPLRLSDMKDVLIRVHMKFMMSRPEYLETLYKRNRARKDQRIS
jgi:hypothetical protein